MVPYVQHTSAGAQAAELQVAVEQSSPELADVLDGSEEGCRENADRPEADSGRLLCCLEKADGKALVAAGCEAGEKALDSPEAWREKGVGAGDDVVTCKAGCESASLCLCCVHRCKAKQPRGLA